MKGFKHFVKGLDGKDLTSKDLKLAPQIMLTFKTGITEIWNILFIKGEPAKTFTVPTNFCLKAIVKPVNYWEPIDPVSFGKSRLEAGSTVTLDYDSVRELFQIKFSGTVVKMIGKQ